MGESTTIKLKRTTKSELDKLGSKGDTYDDILQNLIAKVKEIKKL